MTKLFALGLVALFALDLSADTFFEDSVELNFSERAESYAAKVGTRYIKFVPEDVTFPDGPQKAKFQKALEIMEEVLNSEEFKQKVIGYERRNERSYQRNYLWTDSSQRLSNEEIYEILMDGDEKTRPGTPGEMNFNSWVKTCKFWEAGSVWCRNVIGSTTPYTSYWIRLNWKFYKNFETHEMISNMVHEWIHLLGFLHGNELVTEEVPYVVGRIAGDVAKKIHKSETL